MVRLEEILSIIIKTVVKTMNQNQIIEAGLKEILRKEEFLKTITSGEFRMPQTVEEVSWFEEYFKDKPESQVPESMKDVAGIRFRRYLSDNYAKGITEFRISIFNTDLAMIHPLGKDGETLDFYF